jgi:transposase InsO family protein
MGQRPAFTAKSLREWLQRICANIFYVEPGSPWKNGYCDSFNRTGPVAQRGDLLQLEGSLPRDPVLEARILRNQTSQLARLQVAGAGGLYPCAPRNRAIEDGAIK